MVSVKTAEPRELQCRDRPSDRATKPQCARYRIKAEHLPLGSCTGSTLDATRLGGVIVGCWPMPPTRTEAQAIAAALGSHR